MQRSVTTQRGSAGRWLLSLGGVGLISFGLCGCAAFWDDVSSRNFSFSGMFTKKDPMVVLRDSNDGYERGQALSALREPLQNGGSQKEQDLVVSLLTTAAVSDREPYCRLNAIKTLGGYKDQRAVGALRTVYEQKLGYTSELNAVIRMETVKALSQTGSPAAKQVLVLVAKEPPATGSERDVQESLDRRLTAVRGLANFKDGESAEALFYVLSRDQDQAMKKGAHDSLKKVTGRDLPLDARAWDQALHPGGRPGGAIVQVQQRSWWNPFAAN